MGFLFHTYVFILGNLDVGGPSHRKIRVTGLSVIRTSKFHAWVLAFIVCWLCSYDGWQMHEHRNLHCNVISTFPEIFGYGRNIGSSFPMKYNCEFHVEVTNVWPLSLARWLLIHLVYRYLDVTDCLGRYLYILGVIVR